METGPFAVRPHSDGAPNSHFEVFDRTTGAAVASGMSRDLAEADARRRNYHSSGTSDSAAPLHLPEFAALRAAIDAYVSRTAHHSRILVARAAQALDELRAELAHADAFVAEQQTLLGTLYELFPDSDEDTW